MPEWCRAPTFYFASPHAVLGPDDAVSPPVTERLDFELEVAAVIGGPGGSNLDARESAASIFGLGGAPTFARKGTGMNVTTKLIATVPKSKVRLRGNGRSSTGG